MKTKKRLKKSLLFLLLTTMGLVSAQADVITFTWKRSTSQKYFFLKVTNKEFTIDWGDGQGAQNYAGTIGEYITCTQPSVYSDEAQEYTVTVNGEFSYLGCDDKQLTSLDLSQSTALTELSCDNNQLTSLDLSQSTALTELSCFNNQLTSLDVSNNPVLDVLICFENQLTSLDLSQSTALTYLSCHDNQLTSLDLSQNTALAELACDNNQLTSLDLSQNTALTYLSCNGNHLSLSDLYTASQGITNAATKYMGAQTRILSAITNTARSLAGQMTLGSTQTDFVVTKDGLAAIENVDYELDYINETITFRSKGTFVATLTNAAISSEDAADLVITFTTSVITFTWKGDASEKSFMLSATNGIFFTIDWGDGQGVQNYVGTDNAERYTQPAAYSDENQEYTVTVGGEFSYLDVGNNRLTSLDISAAPALTALDCFSNQLTNLDVSNNPALKSLFCLSNQLTSLDVSNNPVLDGLDCSSNQLTNLDVSNNPALTYLSCYDNQLTNLNISNNLALNDLNCSSNQLPLSDLYAASQEITDADHKYLGTQTRSLSAITNTAHSLTGQMTLGVTPTDFVVTKDGVAATENVDYELDYINETITFRSIGTFEATLTNNAIVSYVDSPAKAVITFAVSDTETGISEMTSPTLTLYPNPVKDVLYVNSASSVKDVTIFSAAGSIVLQRELVGNRVNVSLLSKGSYIVKLTTENGVVIRKMIKE